MPQFVAISAMVPSDLTKRKTELALISILWRCVTGKHQHQPACFQNAVPAGIDRLKSRQYSLAFGFRNSNRVCATAFDHLSKFHCKQLKLFRVFGAVFLDRSEERRVGKECRSRWSPY